jgi:hypothetical protein
MVAFSQTYIRTINIGGNVLEIFQNHVGNILVILKKLYERFTTLRTLLLDCDTGE